MSRFETVGILAGLLLVVYPISDAVATLFDLRGDDASGAIQLLVGVQRMNRVGGQYSVGGAVWYLLTAVWRLAAPQTRITGGETSRGGSPTT